MNRKYKISLTSIVSFCLIFVQMPPVLAKTVPQQAVILYQTGLQLYQKNPKQALADFALSAKLAPWWEPPVYEQGQLLAPTDFKVATTILLHAAKLAPKDDTVWNILGWGYYQHSQFSQAIQAFSTQLAIAKNNDNARYGLASCYENSAVREFALARQQLLILLHDPAKAKLARKLLQSLPPDAVDLTKNKGQSITYEDVIAASLSYRNNILSTKVNNVTAQNGKPSSPSVAPYISWASQHGLLQNQTIPSFQQPATRLFIALWFAKLYGINQYDFVRPFPLLDTKTVPIDEQMTINSILATRLLQVVSPKHFAPFETMTRSDFSQALTQANAIMKNPPAEDQLLTPSSSAIKQAPYVYFFATGTPDITKQNQDIALHANLIHAIGLTYYPFIKDFPKGSATTRQEQDHTQFLLTAMSAGPAVSGQLATIKMEHIAPFMVLANYNNITHEADPGIVDQMLATNSTRSALIDEIGTIVSQEKLQGITVDFENIWAKDRANYVVFMQALHQKMSALGATTMICLPERDKSTSGTSPYDYRSLAQNADLVMLITYDEHVPSTQPGAIAALFNDQRVIQYALLQIPAQKILLGVADYGYDWSQGSGVEVSMQQAENLAATYHATITVDKLSQTPTFSYKDATGVLHTVWFEDQQSLSKVDYLIQKFSLRGIAVWHIGAENAGFWKAFP